MRNYPTEQYEQEELENLNAEQWMVELLKLNPDYCSWGPHEDYMCSTGGGWSDAAIHKSWEEFGPWKLDDLNEVVNFYFEIVRENDRCEECDGVGYNAETKKLYDSWYGKPTYRDGWINKLTDDEVKLLWENNRLFNYKQCPTAEEFNSDRKNSILLDSISCFMCVKARAERLGVYGLCEKCSGKGYVYTAPKATVNLILWFIHPRKGCSRGVEVQNLSQEDVTQALNFLQRAAQRNAERFNKIFSLAKCEPRPLSPEEELLLIEDEDCD